MLLQIVMSACSFSAKEGIDNIEYRYSFQFKNTYSFDKHVCVSEIIISLIDCRRLCDIVIRRIGVCIHYDNIMTLLFKHTIMINLY